ncbi:competence protein [Staphylococcus gallinarum]|uniref:Competence protein n=1 Tax=Staphylococcus gallinarum TaxID=1293 RepID=A0A380FFG0_STAGA|nr:competence protein [Staphylococcus gallinarum]
MQYPDIVVEQRYAIEIQFSQINCDFVLKRTNGLTLNNLNVVWIIKNPNYNKRKYLLFLTRFQRAFINPRNRTLFAWELGKSEIIVVL